ncbi:hypothetical protein BOO69_08410 [Sulfitobacter alexandrii]|uniref:GSCFA domain-containing protein n=1 Tax=Sulfitobacter alexandrii TaxID=1917485 RepID=A0A1J0WGH9_9RHOB|nr:GSCFA domain-containing protein [Sulfitobacter alexandrii]APE43437.1 hypothetical protein BOO69_08410 [Sulfitobacter alexandrii]
MKRKHPYIGLDDRQFWKRAPAGPSGQDLDPVSDVPFVLKSQDKIVTAGSCFAQHVARYLTEQGFNHYVSEAAYPFIEDAVAKRHNYGLFSARYGNLYTARQLLQLLQRAYGLFDPVASHWKTPDGKAYADPFRPQIQPGGFSSLEELEADRKQHLAAVRQSIENMDVFVFTLGLTEAWLDKRDGAVFPIAPGVAGGEFDEEIVEFYNFDHDETADDLMSALQFIRSKNPTVKFIVTVSPVPLNATYLPRHVWTSTTWSKAALRIAAEKVTASLDDCCYFPSYEVITSPHVRGGYYADDGREVLLTGVDHVMALFAKHFFENTQSKDVPVSRPEQSEGKKHNADMEQLIELLCDEEAIDNT